MNHPIASDLQRSDGISPIDRVELAVEHALREGRRSTWPTADANRAISCSAR